MNRLPDHEKRYTIQEAAKIMGVSVDTLRRWDTAGFLVPVRTDGNQRRYTAEQLNSKRKKPYQRTAPRPVVVSEVISISPQEPPKIIEEILSLPEKRVFQTVAPLPEIDELGTLGLEATPITSVARKGDEASRTKSFFFSRARINSLSIYILAGFFLIGLSALILSVTAKTIIPTIQSVIPGSTRNLASMDSRVHGNDKLGEAEVLAEASRSMNLLFRVNSASSFGQAVAFDDVVTMKSALTVDGQALFNQGLSTNNQNGDFGTGIVIASNIPEIYVESLTAGTGVTLTGTASNPIINASVGGVTSFQGNTGAISLSEGDGIDVDGLKISNTGVTSFQGNTGSVTLTAGSGISISGTTISANAAPSQWSTTGTDIYYTSGNVGIGTATPGSTLDVTGTVRFGSITGGTLKTDGSGNVTAAAVNLTTDVTGVLPIVNGGTGATSLTDLIALGTNTTGNYVDSLTVGNGLAVTGSPTEGWAPGISLDVTTSGTTLTASSNSGLETASDGLSLIRGCQVNEILKWNGMLWQCASDGGGGGGGIDTIQEGGVNIVTSATAINFIGNDFIVTNSGGGVGAIAIDYANSNITRSDQNESITGIWTFDDITLNGDTFTDLTGTGLQITAGVLETTLGNSVDLTSEVSGILPVANGGTGANTLADLITLGTMTTGDYVATVTGNAQIGVSGSGSEAATVSLSINNDAIGDGQLQFDTGQSLTTVSSPTFNGLTVSSLTRGADAITDFTGTGLQMNAGALETTLGTSVSLTSEVSGILPLTNGGTNANLTAVNGGIVYSDADSFEILGAGTSGYVLQSNGSGAPSWVPTAGLGTNYWQRVAGNLSPVTLNDTISATTSAAIALTITQTGAFDVVRFEDQSADSTPFVIDQAGNVGIGLTNPSHLLSVSGTASIIGALTLGTSVTLAGDTIDEFVGTGLQVVSGDLQTTLGTSVDLTSEVTGILPVANGGTGVNGNSASNGQLLIGNGTGYSLATLTEGEGIDVTNGSGTITLAGEDASDTNKGIASFTTTNFTVSSGAVSITADSIGDSQLAFNTGQNLTTTSSPTFNGLTVSSLTRGTDTITDFTGTGLQLSAGALETTLGTSVDLTSEVTGILPMANGGSGANLTAVNGGIVYSDADSFEVLAAGTSGYVLQSNGAGAPSWVPAGGVGTNFWQQNSGSLAPLTVTNSLVLGGGTTTPFFFEVNGSKTGKALVSLNETGDQNILTASASGLTKFNIGNNGNIGFAGNTGFMNTLTSAATGNRTYTLPDTTGTICIVEAGNCAGSGGGVVGSGTTNFVSKFTGTGTIGNSSIFDDGNVGIGLTNPVHKFSVSGTANISGALTLGTSVTMTGDTIDEFVGTGLQVVSGDLQTTLGTSVSLTSEVTGILPLANGGTNANLTAVNGGIVYSDTDSFEILGAGISGYVLQSNGAGAPSWVPTAGLGTNYWKQVAGNLSPFTLNDTISATTSAATALTITQTGAFDVVRFEDQASDASPFVINQDGNVGIGLTNPAHLLSVNGTANVSGATTLGSTLNVTGNTTLTADLAVNGGDITSTGALTITPNAGSNLNIALSGAGDFAVNTNQLYVDTSTGNVGIGTTTPAGLLGILKNADNANPMLRLTNSSTGTSATSGMTLSAGAIDINLYVRNQTHTLGRALVLDTDSLTPFIITNIGSEIMQLSNTGNLDVVGTLTAGTANAFTVSATGAIATVTDETINGIDINAGAISDVTSIQVGADTINDFTGTGLQVSGNALQTTLGISVDLASAEVTGILPLTNGGTNKNLTAVDGGIVYSDTDSFEILGAGTSGYVLQSNGAAAPSWVPTAGLGTNYWQRLAGNLSPVTLNDTLSATTSAATALTITQTGAFDVVRFEDQSGDSTPFVITQTGNVGIGTTNPGQELEVAGDILIASGGIIDTSAAGTLGIGINTQNGLTIGRSGAATTINGSGLSVGPTSWTATPTISGLITATSGLTANGALTANNTFTLGDNGDTGSINTSDWDISTLGVLTNISGITTDGGYTQSGSTANTLSGATTISATGTALTISGAATTGLLFSNTGLTTDITLQNGESIDNETNGTVTLTTTTLALSGTATLNGTSLTAFNGGATAIDFAEFDVSASTGSITINDGGNAGNISIEGSILDINTLDFVGVGAITTGGATNFTIDVGGTSVLFGNNDVLNVGGAAATAYNFFAGSTASSILADGDNDLYIEGEFEVDGGVLLSPTSTDDIVFTTDGDTDFRLNGLSSGTGNALCIDTGASDRVVTCTVGSGGISGTGTVGQIPYFNGTSSITSETSGFAWDFTNNRLGLGTDTPDAKLHVMGANIGKALAIFNETGNQDIFTASASGATRFVIQNGGNVGIGSTAPEQLLSVIGADPIFLVRDTDSSTTTANARLRLAESDGSNLTHNYWDILAGVGSDFNFSIGSNSVANALTILRTNGNVGVGTSTPSTKFEIDGGTTQANLLTLDSNMAGGQSTYMSFQNNGTNKWALGTGVSSFGDTFSIYDYDGTGEKNRLLIDTNGNIGIGTTTPTAAMLQINNSTASTTGLQIGTNIARTVPNIRSIGYSSDNVDAGGGIELGNGIAGSVNMFMYRRIDNDFVISTSGSATDNLYIQPKTNLFLNPGSNVGIGTTGPDRKLDVLAGGAETQLRLTNTDGVRYTDFRTNEIGNLEITPSGGNATMSANLTISGGLVATPRLPVIAGSTATDIINTQEPQGIAIQGRYAYVASRISDTFSVIDVSTPSSPTRVATLGSAGDTNFDGAFGVAVNGNYAYVASESVDKITVVDISNPTSPQVVGSVASATQLDALRNITLSGKYIYAAARNDDRITAVDVSDPRNPVIVGSSPTDSTDSNDPYFIYVQGKYAYVAVRLDSGGVTTGSRLTIFDISDATNIVKVGVQTSPNLVEANGVYVSGRYAYVTGATSDSLVIFDVSDPYIPIEVGHVTDASFINGPQKIMVFGKYAYVATSTGDRFDIIDVSNPTAPTLLQSLVSSTQLDGIAIFDMTGRYIYATSSVDDLVTVIDTGYELPTLYAGALGAGQLFVENDGVISNSLNVGQGLSVGGNITANEGIASFYRTASPSAGIQYGISSILSDTGATSTGTDTTYGMYSKLTRTGASAGTINSYGGYFDVTGDTGGTSTVTGLYTSATGADTNYALYSAAGTNYFAGNVGVGVTNPSAKLTLSNNASTGNIDAFSEYQLLMHTNALAGDSYGMGIESNTMWFNSGGGAYKFFANGTAVRMMIDTSGRIGLGTTTPTAALDIAGTTGASTSGILTFRGTTDPAINFLNGENLNFQSSVGGDAGLTSRLFINGNTGNIGIGTTAPTAKVNIVSGSSDGVPALTVSGGATGAATTEYVGYFLGRSSTFPSTVLRLASNRASSSSYNFIEAIQDEDGTPATAFIVRGDGNVGIGATSPGAKLDVSGGTGLVGIFSGRVQGGDAVNSNEFATLGQIAGGAGQFWQRSLGRLVPTNITDDVLLGSTATSSALIRFGGTANANSFFNTGGNVGIGTTSPNTLLTVQSSVDNSAATVITDNSGVNINNESGVANAFAMLRLGSWGGDDGNFIRSIGVANNNVELAIGRYLSTGTINEYMRITNAGNVGIGTTDPSSFKLQVAGGIGPNANDSTDLGSDSLRFRDLYLGPDTLHIGTSTSDEYAIGYNTTSNYLGFNANGSGNPEVVFYSTGNVGIGTTAPTALLQVLGTAASAQASAGPLTGTTADPVLNILGGEGGGVIHTANNSNAMQGGTGSAISLTPGAGGTVYAQAGVATVNYLGGTGGQLNLNGGTGGILSMTLNNGAVNGGVGGKVAITGGAGGAITGGTFGNYSSIGGVGGSLELAGGTGGAAQSSSTGTETGGAGGDLFLAGGAGGAGDTAAGAAGNVLLGITSGGTVRGNVGIGITAPLFPLHIRRDQASTTSILLDNTNTAGSTTTAYRESTNGFAEYGYINSATAGTNLLNIASSGILRTGTSATGGLTLVTQANAPIRFATGGTTLITNERMRIGGTGNIEMGNDIGDSDGGLLNLASGSDVFATDIGEPENYLLNLRHSVSTNGAGNGIAFSSVAGAGFDVGAAIIFKRTGAESQGELGFYTKQSTAAGADPVQAMVISNAGNVGIGTTNPSSFKLQVNGNIGPDAAPTISATTQTSTTLETTNDVGYYSSTAIGTDGFPIIVHKDETADDLRAYHCNNAACTSGTATILDSTGNVGRYARVTIGGDGYPVIAYGEDNTTDALKVYKCSNVACTSGSASTLLSGDVGWELSITTGKDGFPVIAYWDGSPNFNMVVTKCGNAACTSGNTTTNVDTTGDMGLYSSITIGSDGYPILAYIDNTNKNLQVTKCGNAACSSGNTTTTVDSIGDVGKMTSIAIAPDGLPIISFVDATSSDLRVTKCGNIACSSGNTTTSVDTAGTVASDQTTSIAIGNDGRAVIAYYDNLLDDLRVLKCGNATCASGNTIISVDSSGDTGQWSSLVVPTDGLPFISYYYATGGDLRVSKCATASCSQTTGLVYTGGSDLGSSNSFFKNVYAAQYFGKQFQIANYSDLAENYNVDGGYSLGDIVRTKEGTTLTRSTKQYDEKVIGIVSTNPGITLGAETGSTPIALAGRVPVNIASDSASIEPGDYITTSATPGKGMKATQAGMIVGVALESWTPDDADGQVLVFVNRGFQDPELYITDSGDVSIIAEGVTGFEKYMVQAGDETVEKKGFFSDIFAGNVKAGSIDAQKITISGKSLEEFFASLEGGTASGSSVLSASNSGILTQQGDSLAMLQNDMGGVQSDIGVLQNNDIALRFDIDSMKSQMASISGRFETLESLATQAGSTSAMIEQLLHSPLFASGSAGMDQESGSMETLVIGETLQVLGRTTLTDLGVTGNITAGTLSINGLEGSVNTVGQTLKLQNLGVAGVDILDGKVTIDTDGNIHSIGTISAEKVQTKTVSTERLEVKTAAGVASPSAVLSTSAGIVTIEAGETSIDVSTSALTSKSLLFTTPDEPVTIGTKQKDADTFTIRLNTPATRDVKVNWWLIN